MRFRFWFNPAPAKQALLAAGEDVRRGMADFMAEKAALYAPVDTGELRASIQVIASSGSSYYHVVATATHAEYVEFGTFQGDTWRAPVPFMRMALADTVSAFPQIAGAVKLGRPGESGGQSLGVSIAK